MKNKSKIIVKKKVKNWFGWETNMKMLQSKVLEAYFAAHAEREAKELLISRGGISAEDKEYLESALSIDFDNLE